MTIPSRESQRSESEIEVTPRTKMLLKVDQEADRRDRLLQPLRESVPESLNSITQLSGGALVVSISVVQFIGDKISNPTAGWLLPMSWIAFTLTLMATQYLRASLSNLTNYRLIMHSAGITALEDPVVPRDPDAAAEAAVMEANVHFEKVLSRMKVLEPLAGWSFLTGFVTLMLFAILNLPF